jgi:outer membrane biosynthesis protein TonB
LDERRSYWAWAASSALHGALLALILLGFASAPRFADSPEPIAIETVSLSEMNQVMNGEKNAEPAPEPPPRPEVSPEPPTPPEAPPELHAVEEPVQAPAPSPSPPPRPEPQPKPAPAPPKAVAQDPPMPPVRIKIVETPPERPKEEKPKPDQLAKLIDDKSEPQPKPAHVYDPKAIAKLIGQPKPAASANNPASATAATPQGLPHHDAPRMSLSLASALDAWLIETYLNCWTPPPTMPEGDVYVAEVKVTFNPDGSLSARPVLINPPTDPSWKAHAESAMRAVKKCDPLRVPPEYAPYFDEWRVETIHFDPRETQG